MTPLLLLDTSGLLAYLFASEARHEAAVDLITTGRRKMTHSHIFAELVALVQARGYRLSTALDFLDDLIAHPLIEVVWVDALLHARAVALLRARADKEYSLADAVSFVLMRERSTYDALTTDHHFEQEGFYRLLS